MSKTHKSPTQSVVVCTRRLHYVGLIIRPFIPILLLTDCLYCRERPLYYFNQFAACQAIQNYEISSLIFNLTTYDIKHEFELSIDKFLIAHQLLPII
jgi:hypothetical protein